MKKIIFIIFLCCSFTTNANKYFGQPLAEIYTPSEIQGHFQNWCLYQTNNDFIYVCNGNSIRVWDGESWSLLRLPNNLGPRQLTEWKGQIYLGLPKDLGLLSENGQGVKQFKSLLTDDETLEIDQIWSVAATEDYLYFVDTSQIFVWDNENLTQYDIPDFKSKVYKFKNKLYLKTYDDIYVYEITPTGLNKTNWQLPERGLIRGMFQTAYGDFMVTNNFGIYSIGSELELIKNPFNSDVFIFNSILTNDGYLYVASINKGLFILDHKLDIRLNLTQSDKFGMSQVADVIQDRQGNIWAAGSPNIVVMQPPHIMGKIVFDGDNNTVLNIKNIGDETIALGRGAYKLSDDNERHQAKFKHWLEFRTVNDVIEYDYDILVFAHSTGIQVVNYVNGQARKKQNLLTGTHVNSLFRHPRTSFIYAASDDGLFEIKQERNQWIVESVDGVSEDVSRLIMGDQGYLWVGDDYGNIFQVEPSQIGTSSKLIRVFTEKNGIAQSNVVPFVINNQTYIGTFDGAMQWDEFNDNLQMAEGLPEIFTTKGQDIHRVYQDHDNNTFYRIGNHSGLAKFNQEKWSINEKLFLPFKANSIQSFLKVESTLYFVVPGVGVYYLNQPEHSILPPQGKLHFRAVEDKHKGELLFDNADNLDSINRNYNDTALRLLFAFTDYSLPNKTLYRSRVVGSISPSWSVWNTENFREVDITKGGTYELEIQAKDGWERLSEIKSITFTIEPPWFASFWAYTAYAILFIIINILIANYYSRYRNMKLEKAKLQLQKTVKEKTKNVYIKAMELEQTQMAKDRFFDDFSHELRTPLSLVMAPLEQLRDKDKNDDRMLDLAIQNADKLRNQVNRLFQIHDANFNSNDLSKSVVDLRARVQELVKEFMPWSIKLKQHMELVTNKQEISCFCDADKMDAVFRNLLSNAIKYSGQQSNINVNMAHDSEKVVVSVIDDGPGVAQQDQQKVFSRDFKSDENNQSDQPAVGIGLSIVKDVVEAHNGSITLSTNQPHGAHFMVMIPTGMNANCATIENESRNEEDSTEQLQLPKNDIMTIMLVEDNDELREFLIYVFATSYKVVDYANPVEALKDIDEILPDVIVSDVMMPEMNGIEFTVAVREKTVFSAIPIILLTAKSTQSDVEKGLTLGATDYMVKPFSPKELLLRVDNHINTLKSIVSHYKIPLKSAKAVSKTLQKINEIIKNNLHDTNFSTSALAEMMFMDRTTLFRKIKKEVGLSPVKYIKSFKMEVAAQLLMEKDVSVSEVAYLTGFDSLAYFSANFKAHYQQTPSEYIAKLDR